jgi:hypothetical protein
MARVTLSTDLDLARQAFRRVEDWALQTGDRPWYDLATGLQSLVDAVEYVTEGLDELQQDLIGTSE